MYDRLYLVVFHRNADCFKEDINCGALIVESILSFTHRIFNANL